MRRILILAALGIAFISQQSAAEPETTQRPIILALQGFDFLRFVGLGDGHKSTYLGNALSASWDFECPTITFINTHDQIENCPIIAPFWSGDLNDGSLRDYTSKAVDVLTTAIREYPDRPIVVVAHSWGSVVAYDAVNQLVDLGWRSGEIDLMISLGSPLGSPCGAFFRNELNNRAPNASGISWIGDETLIKPPSVLQWINLWVPHDRISGPLPEGQEDEFENVAINYYPKIGKKTAGHPL